MVPDPSEYEPTKPDIYSIFHFRFALSKLYCDPGLYGNVISMFTEDKMDKMYLEEFESYLKRFSVTNQKKIVFGNTMMVHKNSLQEILLLYDKRTTTLIIISCMLHIYSFPLFLTYTYIYQVTIHNFSSFGFFIVFIYGGFFFF